MSDPQGPSFFELMVQALSSTERGYDLLARKFDYTPFRTPDEVIKTVVPHIGQVDRILDVCCGTGAAMKILRPCCRREITGIDFSTGMLEEARRRLEGGPGTAEIKLLRGDALALPFDGVFDVATSFGAFGHILPDDEPQFVDGIRRALRPGGRFVFVTTSMPPRFSQRRLMARGFNAVMHVRNAIWRPKFIMYYLTFLLPGVKLLLESHGYRVEVHPSGLPAPFTDVEVVIATRRR